LYKLARIISTVFIPPTFTLFSFLFLAIKYEIEVVQKIYVLAVAFIFGVLLQIASFVFFYKKGIISDVDAKEKNERDIPFLISIVLFIIGLILLFIGEVNIVSMAFWFCYISNTFMVLLINKYLKISIHAMGVSGPLAMFVFFVGVEAFAFLPILFIVGWSRVKLKVHSMPEVTAGAVFGFVSVYLQLFLILTKY
jgi:membrane-associated phospholipid phosphatase